MVVDKCEVCSFLVEMYDVIIWSSISRIDQNFLKVIISQNKNLFAKIGNYFPESENVAIFMSVFLQAIDN